MRHSDLWVPARWKFSTLADNGSLSGVTIGHILSAPRNKSFTAIYLRCGCPLLRHNMTVTYLLDPNRVVLRRGGTTSFITRDAPAIPPDFLIWMPMWLSLALVERINIHIRHGINTPATPRPARDTNAFGEPTPLPDPTATTRNDRRVPTVPAAEPDPFDPNQGIANTVPARPETWFNATLNALNINTTALANVFWDAPLFEREGREGQD